MDGQHPSEGNVSDIQTLTDRVDALSHSIDSWNFWMVVMLVIAAAAAAGGVVTTRTVIYKSRQLSQAQVRLSTAKDAQLAITLKDKDQKIAEANDRASQADLARARL